MRRVVVTVFSLFFSAFAWPDIPDGEVNFPENDNSFSINSADVPGSQPQIETANPDPDLVVDVCEKVKFNGMGLHNQDDFFAPHDQYDNMPRYYGYPHVDKMPSVDIDFSVDAKILKLCPNIGIGLLESPKSQHLHKYLPFKK